MKQITEEQDKKGPLGSQPPGRPLSQFLNQLQLLGDMSLGLICILLLFTQPLPNWLFICLLSMMRIVVGPNIGLLALLIGMPMLSLMVLDSLSVRRCHPTTPLTACKSNLKNIATACEMYSTDNAGRYPHSLEQLTPQYLKALPSCPGAKRDTYSQAFRSQAQPDAFTICCYGLNHEESGINKPNYPRYGNVDGLTER